MSWDLSAQRVTIHAHRNDDGVTVTFTAEDDTGRVLAMGVDGREIGRKMRDRGADPIVYAYDLNLDEPRCSKK